MVSGEGLRSRKQRETRQAIHEAAVRNALAQGPDAATVAEISAEAQVSTRTFFNYFACKEDAMLGFAEDGLSDRELARFAATTRPADDLMSEVVDLMIRMLWSSPGGALDTRRRQLLNAHPELVRRQFARVAAIEQRITDAVAQRMRASDRFTGRDIAAEATMLVLLCSGIVRFALRQAANSSAGSDDPDRLITASLTTFREVIHTLP
jgi:AcrR family transcriptional regulator